MKRSHLKRYSSGYINTGPTPNKQVLSEYAHHARSLAIRDEWLSVAFPNKELDTPERIHEAAKKGVPRAVVLLRLMEQEQGVNKKHQFTNVSMLNSKYESVRLYISSDLCFFIRRLTRSNVVLTWTSLFYSDPSRAKRDWGYGRVTWIYPPTETVTPPNSE